MNQINDRNIKVWSKLGMLGAFSSIALVDLAKEDEKIIAMVADTTNLMGMQRFQNMYPERFYNLGISEQNLIGVASGYSDSGYKVFAGTYASFLCTRGLEFIKQNLGYMKKNVVILGAVAGVESGRLGISHWSIEDISYLRAIPNIRIISPADALEAVKLAYLLQADNVPTYVRFTGGTNIPILYTKDYTLEIGKAVSIIEGKDTTIIAVGEMVSRAVQVAESLKEFGISCGVINMHTIKPIDEACIEKLCRSGQKIIFSLEEHNIIGGLGSAIAECLSGQVLAPRLVRLGFDDSYRSCGSRDYILKEYNIDHDGLVSIIRNELDDIRRN